MDDLVQETQSHWDPKRLDMPIPKSELEELVFDFWNSFKGSKSSSSKLDPKSGLPTHWHSHNKFTHDMRLAIRESLKDYTLEEICMAIDNYALVLLGDEYFWTHVWPMSIFFTVKYDKTKNGTKKWWQFLPENFNPQAFLRGDCVNGQEKLVEDTNPDLTNRLTILLQKWGLCKKGFVPSSKQIGQLRLTVQRMMEFYGDRTCQDKEVWLEDLYDCLDQNYLSKGEAVSIGLLCSDHVWSILMPQLLRCCGGN